MVARVGWFTQLGSQQVLMYLEVLGQTADAWLVETPLTSPASNPTPFHTSTLAPVSFLFVGLCLQQAVLSQWLIAKRKKKVDSSSL